MLKKEIELTYELIEDNFKLDEELISTYHIEEGNDYKKCSLRTYNDLLKADTSLKIYGIYKEDILIGFFGTEFDNYVNTIFVKPEYRKRDYMKTFITNIIETVGKTFFTALYNKNTRAINFYLKLGGNILEQNNEYCLIKVEV